MKTKYNMNRKGFFFAAAAGILLVSIAIANADHCVHTGWTQGKPRCRAGLRLVYEMKNPASGNRGGFCCIPGSDDEKRYQGRATGCQVTKCVDPRIANPCSTEIKYETWYNGRKINYEEVNRESCTSDLGSHGVAAYCCQKGSLESALATKMGAEPHEFPHMALLSVAGSQCGGTIYNKRWIITAAHCIVDEDTYILQTPDETWVAKVGRNIGGVEMPENDYKIIKAIPHPQYSQMKGHPNLMAKVKKTFNDIAFLELDRDIVFGEHVKALQIAPEGFEELANADQAVVVGWGVTDTMQTSDNLLKANFIIRNDHACFDYIYGHPHAWQFNRTEKLLCVGGILEGKWSPTAGQGDSGGPAICRGVDGYPVLCGVTSYGGSDTKCAANNDEKSCVPSVYTEVDYFRDVIHRTAGKQDERTFHKVKLYGEVVRGPKYEHQVHIKINPTSKNVKSCGGTLIAPDLVLTAAQCIAGDDSTDLYSGVEIWSGIQDISSGKGQSHDIKRVMFHEGFKRAGEAIDIDSQGNRVLITDQYYKNDLAIIKLLNPVKIDPRNLPRIPEVGEVAAHSGLEYAFPRNTSRGGELRQREFNILDKHECQRRMDRLEKVKLNVKVDEHLLCGVEKYSGGSTCDRELGGGLICKGKNGKDTLCGIQVFRLCEWSIPNGFLDIAQFSGWIQDAKSRL